jgi:aconitate hydratase
VWLRSPETAAAAALTGRITDPRDLAEQLGMAYPELNLPAHASVNTAMLVAPLPESEAQQVELVKGPNISGLPDFDPIPDLIEAPVLLKVGDNISTDEISPAGRALPFRSNIPKLAEFTFTQIDETYPARAAENASSTGHVIVGGENYGQGSSREHAAITPRYLGLRVVIAKSFARIHWQNLANFGILALEFENPDDYDDIAQGDVLRIDGVRDALRAGTPLVAHDQTRRCDVALSHRLSQRQVMAVLAGGVIPLLAE